MAVTVCVAVVVRGVMMLVDVPLWTVVPVMVVVEVELVCVAACLTWSPFLFRATPTPTAVAITAAIKITPPISSINFVRLDIFLCDPPHLGPSISKSTCGWYVSRGIVSPHMLISLLTSALKFVENPVCCACTTLTGYAGGGVWVRKSVMVGRCRCSRNRPAMGVVIAGLASGLSVLSEVSGPVNASDFRNR